MTLVTQDLPTLLLMAYFISSTRMIALGLLLAGTQ